jgi:uncharacterized protein (DUF488 family)
MPRLRSKQLVHREVRPRRRNLSSTAFTIGHSSRTLDQFLDLLKAHEIERVADIRTIPRSRRNPQFNRETLPARLRARHIGYVHLTKLGGLRRAHANSHNMGWHNASFRGFADYMQTPDFEAGLVRLLKLARSKRTAMMCAEAVPWRCHRSLVSDALLMRGIRVEHIMSGKSRQVHAITPFARVRGKTILYPPTDSRRKKQKKN